jgi:hypothetical protein
VAELIGAPFWSSAVAATATALLVAALIGLGEIEVEVSVWAVTPVLQ